MVWVALAVQGGGLLFDVAWHALNRDFNPVTVDQMLTHLGTVHLPIYIGAVAVLLTTVLALIDQARRSSVGIARPAAVAGALVATSGEAWHAYTHLQLSTHGGPVAGMVGLIGFLTVLIAVALGERWARRPVEKDAGQRRAA
jgi:hypothetical protein